MKWLILLMVSNLLFPTNSSVSIEVNGLKNHKGQLLVAFFKNEDGFPNKSEKAFLRKAVKIKSANNIIVLNDIPTGDYAVSIAHDENMNGKIDYYFIQVPKEGYGFSNIKKPGLFIPAFSKSKISISKRANHIKIPLYYFRN